MSVLRKYNPDTQQWDILQGGVQGLQGPPVALSKGTVTTTPPGTNADFTVTGTPPNQKLNLTIPRGDVGPVGPTFGSDGSIIAAGRPDLSATMDSPTQAAVSSASPGTLFRSTDGASVGAWAWSKRPSGWVVTDGDTGWRNVTALTAEPTAFHMWLRRVGSEVIGYVSVTNTPAGSSILTPPAGFAANGNPWGGAHASAAPVGAIGRMGGAQSILFFGPEYGPNTLMSEGIAAALKRGYARWTTQNAWPATLPGTPA